MQVWKNVKIKDTNKDVLVLSKSFTNYLYGYGPIHDICRKYNINKEDRAILDKYTADRIAGLLLLYLSTIGSTSTVTCLVSKARL